MEKMHALEWQQNGVIHKMKLLPGERIGTLTDEILTEVRMSSGKPSEKVLAIREGNIQRVRQLQKPEGKEIVTSNIRQWEITISGDEYDVPVTVCAPEIEQEKRNCIIYIHGGGWQYGSREIVQPFCRFLAEQADAVVINPEYRLAPEYPYPAAADDCYNVLVYVYQHAKELGIDAARITVAGDSAGGNLAAICSHRDRDEKTGMISKQVLYYAALAVHNVEGLKGFHFDLSDYIYDDSQKQMIEPRIMAIYHASQRSEDNYIPKNEDSKNPKISPLWDHDFKDLPETLLITAQYDYLTQQSKLYAQYLAENKVPVTWINYCGVPHAFVDKCGIYPQADDSLLEFAEFVKR